jgi:hypothetical protein
MSDNRAQEIDSNEYDKLIEYQRGKSDLSDEDAEKIKTILSWLPSVRSMEGTPISAMDSMLRTRGRQGLVAQKAAAAGRFYAAYPGTSRLIHS